MEGKRENTFIVDFHIVYLFSPLKCEILNLLIRELHCLKLFKNNAYIFTYYLDYHAFLTPLDTKFS